MSALPTEFLARVQQEFPADFLSTDPSDLAEYGRDWTKVHAPAASEATSTVSLAGSESIRPSTRLVARRTPERAGSASARSCHHGATSS